MYHARINICWQRIKYYYSGDDWILTDNMIVKVIFAHIFISIANFSAAIYQNEVGKTVTWNLGMEFTMGYFKNFWLFLQN